MARLSKRVPKQCSLSKIHELKKEITENAAACLERIYQAYGKYTDINPEAPENIHIVNMTFIGHGTLDRKRKLQKEKRATRINEEALGLPPIISPQEPQVQLTVRNQLMDFLVDTGDPYSIFNTKLTRNAQKTVSVVGISDQAQQKRGCNYRKSPRDALYVRKIIQNMRDTLQAKGHSIKRNFPLRTGK